MPFDSGTVPVPRGALVALRARPGVYGDLPRDRLVCVQTFCPTHDALQSAGHNVTTQAPDVADLVIVHITRTRDETLGLVARGWSMLPPGGWMVVDGDKRDGIDAIWKTLRKVLPEAQQDSKAHGRVIWVRKDDTRLPDWAAALAPCKNATGFTVTAGVFSADHPDPGSVELAARLDGVLQGRGADFGAGWGWLAQDVLARNPGIVALDLLEAEARALDCARINCTDPRAAFHWADVTRAAGPGHDFIVMNPPFHTGRKPDPSLGRAFIAAAARSLAPRGTLWMVANRQLAYEDVLADCFATVEPVSQSNRFKVIRAGKPRGRR